MLTCVFSLILAAAVFVMWGYTSSRQNMILKLSTQAEIIADNCKASVTFDDPEDAKETLSTLRWEPSIVYACVLTNDGKSFASYHQDGIDRNHNLSEILANGYSFDKGFLTVFRNITVDNKTIASLCIRSDLKPLHAAVKRNIYTVIYVILSTSLVAYLLSAKLQGIISKPILSLTKVAREISDNKEYSVRAEKQSNDEIGVLIDSFNEMLTKIQAHKTQLVEINESLEEKVNERTSELTKEIAGRKQAQEKLQIFYRFAEESSQGVGWADIDGNVIFVNPALCRIFGEDRPEDCYGKPVACYYDDKTKKRLVKDIFPKVLAEGQWAGELNVVRKTGEIVPTLNSVFPMRDCEGKPLCFANTVTDITERKRAEKERQENMKELMKAKKQAEDANVAKSQFLANMSHEIRTPMNGIIGFGDLLADENLTDEQAGYVKLIRNSGNNLLNLINDILDFSKIEAGKMNTELVDCSLSKMLNSVESLMRPKALEKGLEFAITETTVLPETIKTDPMRLQQCLTNLVNNAIKFTETGYVHVNVSLDEFENKPFVRLDVEDTGIGIPADKQELIFESFSQADGTTSRKYGGTGLGLAITKQLSELLGGRLTLTSQEGKGSTFSLMIAANVDITKQPLLDRNNIAGHTHPERVKKEQHEFTGHVLVAEDVKTNQMLIKTLLKRTGLEVTIAEDGNEAVEKALANKFDLILMDMMMPHMNGYDATKELRKQGITTPIIALTANAMKGDDKKCINAGCDGYLAKPINRDKLLEKLQKHLQVKVKV